MYAVEMRRKEILIHYFKTSTTMLILINPSIKIQLNFIIQIGIYKLDFLMQENKYRIIFIKMLSLNSPSQIYYITNYCIYSTYNIQLIVRCITKGIVSIIF